MYTDNNARTVKVDFIEQEIFASLAKGSKRLEKEDQAGLLTAAVERTKLRAADKLKVEFDYSKVVRRVEKNYELRTVDIKDLWQVHRIFVHLVLCIFSCLMIDNVQADVEYGDLSKHTILDWADGTTLDLEGIDLDDTLFLHKGLSLSLDDWTKNTSEYSDFWDSL